MGVRLGWQDKVHLDHVTALVHELSEVADRRTAALHSCTRLGECAPALCSSAACLSHLTSNHTALATQLPTHLFTVQDTALHHE